MPLRWRLTLLITLVCTLTLGGAFGGYFGLEILKLQDDVSKNSKDFANQLSVTVTDFLSTGSEPAQEDWRSWVTQN